MTLADYCYPLRRNRGVQKCFPESVLKEDEA